MGDILTEAIMAGGIDEPTPPPVKPTTVKKPLTKTQKAKRAAKARAKRKADNKAKKIKGGFSTPKTRRVSPK